MGAVFDFDNPIQHVGAYCAADRRDFTAEPLQQIQCMNGLVNQYAAAFCSPLPRQLLPV